MAASSSDLQFDLHLVLKELHQQLQQEGWRFGYEGEAGASGLRVLLNPNLRRIGDQKLYTTLDDHITKLQNDVNFLITFRDCIHKWTNPGKVVWNSGFLVSKINAETNDIAGKLSIACRKQYVFNPSKLIDVLSNSQKNIEKLKPEIAQACQSLSACSIDQVVSPLHHFFLWIEFVHSVAATNLRPLLRKVDRCDEQENIAVLAENLILIASLLNCAQKGFEDGFARDYKMTEHFLLCSAYVAIRAANLSCFFWSKHWADPTTDRVMANSIITDLSSLRSQIDFTTPKMMEMALKFLYGLNEINHGCTMHHEVDLADNFLELVFRGKSKICFSKELIPLVIFVMNIPGKPHQMPLAEGFSAEIKNLILEAAILR